MVNCQMTTNSGMQQTTTPPPKRLAHAMSAWSVKTRRAPSRQRRECEGRRSYDLSYTRNYITPPPPANTNTLRPKGFSVHNGGCCSNQFIGRRAPSAPNTALTSALSPMMLLLAWNAPAVLRPPVTNTTRFFFTSRH